MYYEKNYVFISVKDFVTFRPMQNVHMNLLAAIHRHGLLFHFNEDFQKFLNYFCGEPHHDHYQLQSSLCLYS